MQFMQNAITEDKTRIVRRNYDKALLVLVGLSSIGADWDAIINCFDNIPMDIFVPDFIKRSSLEACSDNLADFVVKHELSDYKELHVFAYILGGAVFNRYLIDHELPNLRSILYDRSPWQERAPGIIVDMFPWIGRMVAGQVLFDLAQSEYFPCPREDIIQGLCIEAERTLFIRFFGRYARRMGTIQWEPSAFQQPHDDYCYISLNHSQMYTRLGEFSALLHHFFTHGCFPKNLNRTPPQE